MAKITDLTMSQDSPVEWTRTHVLKHARAVREQLETSFKVLDRAFNANAMGLSQQQVLDAFGTNSTALLALVAAVRDAVNSLGGIRQGDGSLAPAKFNVPDGYGIIENQDGTATYKRE